MILITATLNGQKWYFVSSALNTNAIIMSPHLKEAKRFELSEERLDELDNAFEMVKKYYPNANTVSDDLDVKTAIEITDDLNQAILLFNSLSGEAYPPEWSEKQMFHFEEFLNSLSKTHRLLKAAISALKEK